MTLLELSEEYRFSASLLRERMTLLRQQLRQCEDPVEQQILKRRIADLTPLYRECREVASYLACYYCGRGKGHGTR